MKGSQGCALGEWSRDRDLRVRIVAGARGGPAAIIPSRTRHRPRARRTPAPARHVLDHQLRRQGRPRSRRAAHDRGPRPDERPVRPHRQLVLPAVQRLRVRHGRSSASGWPATWLLAGMAVVWSLAQLPILVPRRGPRRPRRHPRAARRRRGPGPADGEPRRVHLVPPRAADHGLRRASPIGGALGVIIGGPVLALVIAGPGWRWAFGLLGLVGLVWAAVWVAIGGDGPVRRGRRPAGAARRGAAHRPAPRAPARRCAGSLRRPPSCCASLAGFAAQWTLGVATSWLPSFLEDAGRVLDRRPSASSSASRAWSPSAPFSASSPVSAGLRRAGGRAGPRTALLGAARVAAAGPAADRPLHRRRRGPAAGLHGRRVRLRRGDRPAGGRHAGGPRPGRPARAHAVRRGRRHLARRRRLAVGHRPPARPGRHRVRRLRLGVPDQRCARPARRPRLPAGRPRPRRGPPAGRWDVGVGGGEDEQR